MWQHWQHVHPSLLPGLPRLSQVIALSVCLYSLCLLHSGRQLCASPHWTGGGEATKQARTAAPKPERRRHRLGSAEEQCAKRGEEKLCIKLICCSFSSGGTEECVPDKLSISRPGGGSPRSEARRSTPESAWNPIRAPVAAGRAVSGVEMLLFRGASHVIFSGSECAGGGGGAVVGGHCCKGSGIPGRRSRPPPRFGLGLGACGLCWNRSRMHRFCRAIPDSRRGFLLSWRAREGLKLSSLMEGALKLFQSSPHLMANRVGYWQLSVCNIVLGYKQQIV